MKVQGKIKTIAEIQTFDSGFRKREFVIETQDQYPQLIKLEILKDNIEKLDVFLIEGAEVNVSINLRGNEHNGKVYNSLIAWKIEAV